MTTALHLVTSPFALANHAGYTRWRTDKLDHYPHEVKELKVEIADPAMLSNHEKAALLRVLRKTNTVIYRITGAVADKEAIRRLGAQLGLAHLDANICADDDSITSLQVVNEGRHQGYIPYTNKPLSWHTDGYYNSLDHQIRAIVMHCVTPAVEGGENALLDHEILYLLLRDEDPALISALMNPGAMSIPPNMEGGEEIRGETVGPVFSIMPDGQLHMRYSARTRNITWRDDAATKHAVVRINEILASSNPYIMRYKLQANEGIITNNVLHNRSGFQDAGDTKRLLYRARYYDRVSET